MNRESRRGSLPTWLRALLAGTAFAGLYIAERRRPLRRRFLESKRRRTGRNMAVAATGALAIQTAEAPLTKPLARWVERRRFGVVYWLRVPRWLRIPAAVALLDYTLYLWHILTHRVPFLWRFHEPHHVDLDMDASTGVRFHFGELALSAPWRALQIVTIGVTPRALSVWQTGTLLSILFHHSNVELPISIERWLSRIVVTPRMHGIHHSIVREETDSNWSSGLSIWDRIHGTFRLDIPQDEVTIGVPAFRDPNDVTLGHVLEMPFREQRDTWRLPDGGMKGDRPFAARRLPPAATLRSPRSLSSPRSSLRREPANLRAGRRSRSDPGAGTPV